MPEHSPAPTPSRAVNGFVLYLSFKLIFVLYLIWAIVPEEYFKSIGVDFLPQRHWAVTVPIFFLTVLTIFAFIIYPSLGALMVPNINNLKTITDEFGQRLKSNIKNNVLVENSFEECSCKRSELCYKELYKNNEAKSADKSIPILQDLDMWDVSQHLYLK